MVISYKWKIGGIWRLGHTYHIVVLNSKNSQLTRQEPQPAGTAKWPTTLRFGKILGTTSVVRSIENPRYVLQKIHRP